MTLQTLKTLWQDNKIAIYNRQNKATFDALKLLWNQDTFIFDNIDSNKPGFEVNNWQGMRKTKDTDWFCFEDKPFLEDFTFTLEPTEILKIYNELLCPE